MQKIVLKYISLKKKEREWVSEREKEKEYDRYMIHDTYMIHINIHVYHTHVYTCLCVHENDTFTIYTHMHTCLSYTCPYTHMTYWYIHHISILIHAPYTHHIHTYTYILLYAPECSEWLWLELVLHDNAVTRRENVIGEHERVANQIKGKIVNGGDEGADHHQRNAHVHIWAEKKMSVLWPRG